MCACELEAGGEVIELLLRRLRVRKPDRTEHGASCYSYQHAEWISHHAAPLISPSAFESYSAVTALALRAELPKVHVVLFVTRVAIVRQPHFSCRLHVTRVAAQLFVSAREREVRLFGVIEFPQAPAVRRVTNVAVGSQTTFVYVFRGVARVACLRRFAEIRRRVTAGARHRHMQTD
jgi:hypothetical protein